MDVALLKRGASKEDKIILIRLLSRMRAKKVFKMVAWADQLEDIEGLFQKLSLLLNDIEPDDRTAFFENLVPDIVSHLLQKSSTEEQNITVQLLGYPKDSIGRLMTPEFVAIKEDFTVYQSGIIKLLFYTLSAQRS